MPPSYEGTFYLNSQSLVGRPQVSHHEVFDPGDRGRVRRVVVISDPLSHEARGRVWWDSGGPPPAAGSGGWIHVDTDDENRLDL